MGMFTEWRDDEIAKLQQQLREVRAELERENAELKESRDNWQKKAETVENLLMTIQAWDIDKDALRGHQCLAKQWICSFQDRLNRYKRGKKMSDTPRTDIEIRQVENLFDSPESIDCKLAIKLAIVEFAKGLERELAEARAEIDGLTLMATNASMEPARRLIQKNKELHAVIEQMREALRLADDLIDDYAMVVDHCDNVDEVREQIKAALAAERGEG